MQAVHPGCVADGAAIAGDGFGECALIKYGSKTMITVYGFGSAFGRSEASPFEAGKSAVSKTNGQTWPGAEGQAAVYRWWPPIFDDAFKDIVQSQPNVVRYVATMHERYFAGV